MASRYDDEIWELVPDEPYVAPEVLRRFMEGLDPARHALDLGCGDGRLSGEIPAAQITLADVSPVALERARRRHPTAPLVEGDSDAPLPIEDGLFDLVVCTETIEHVRDTQLLLSEARRVLEPGGRLALSTPAHGRDTVLAILRRGFENVFDPLSPHLRFLTPRSLGALLEAMGFDVLELRTIEGTLLAVARR